MTDDIEIAHRHDDEATAMRTTDENRVDGLIVRQFTCDCGYVAAVLSPVDDEQPGSSWPFAFGRQRALG